MPQIRFGIFRQSMKNLGQIRFDSKIFRLFTLDRHCAIRSKMASEIAKRFDHFDPFFTVMNPCWNICNQACLIPRGLYFDVRAKEGGKKNVMYGEL